MKARSTRNGQIMNENWYKLIQPLICLVMIKALMIFVTSFNEYSG